MRDRRQIEDLSLSDLQRALAERKQAARDARLARFRETGRALPPVSSGAAKVEPLAAPTRPAPRTPARRFLDGLLLILEVGAVLGLLYVLYSGVSALSTLNQETAEVIAQNVQALPTIAPTPIVTAVVLPGGHTPPDPQTGLSRPNDAEIPAHLRQIVQALPPPVIPTQGPQQALRIVIPAINVDAVIVQGDDWEQLKKGVGQHIGSADPGQTGNLVLSAHNDIYGEIFRHLDQLQPGDEVQVYTAREIFTYLIGETRLVPPTEVSVLAPTPHSSVTLISCYPYLINTERIVVTATLRTQ
jgi:sortase A